MSHVIPAAFALMLVGVYAQPLCSQSPTGIPFSARVAVIVSGDEDLRPIVSSYFDRELLSLPGVTVVDSMANWEIHVVAVRTQNQANRETGVAMAVAVLAPFDTSVFRTFASVIPKRAIPAVQRLTADLVDFDDLHVTVSSREDLSLACREVVAKFDANYVEKVRQLWDGVNARTKR